MGINFPSIFSPPTHIVSCDARSCGCMTPSHRLLQVLRLGSALTEKLARLIEIHYAPPQGSGGSALGLAIHNSPLVKSLRRWNVASPQMCCRSSCCADSR